MTLSVATGDINGDGAVDVGDGIFVLDYLYAGGASTCRDASDASGDGAVDIGDAKAEACVIDGPTLLAALPVFFHVRLAPKNGWFPEHPVWRIRQHS
ncbi:MAG: hypothetical protein H8E43_11225 [Planctomycetia bacterium]|nr:hypothetical protein [Planctomycetia bacterium]